MKKDKLGERFRVRGEVGPKFDTVWFTVWGGITGGGGDDGTSLNGVLMVLLSVPVSFEKWIVSTTSVCT